MTNTSHKKRPSLAVALKQIFEGTAEYTGKEFFKSLVKELAVILNVHGVWITEYKEKEQRLNALGFWLDGKHVAKYEYDIKGTPCEPVLERKDIFHVPDKVIDLYPEDSDLPPLGAVSYMGIVLKDVDESILGHLALLDNKPMQEIPDVYMIFKLFASRAAAELRRMRSQEKLEENKRKIDRLLNGTTEAIVELNDQLEIIQANMAACNLFEEERESLISKSLTDILTESSQKQIQFLISGGKISDTDKSTSIETIILDFINALGEQFPAETRISMYTADYKEFTSLHIKSIKDQRNNEATIHNLKVQTTMLQEKIHLHQLDEIIGESPAIKVTFQQIRQVAQTHSTVLILGETGTGKELIAKEIYKQSLRQNKPFITLNCAVLPTDLIDSELFGHVKGAFTGASSSRDGRFALADQGTIFLDEIGELPLSLQAKLLRVVQEGEFQPLGSSTTKKVDVRIIAAIHRNLAIEVENKSFREDLFYRLNVFPILVPPLRERGQDILLLADAFISKYTDMYRHVPVVLSQSQKKQLLDYHWPGNVRELQNVIERMVITSNVDHFHLGQKSISSVDKVSDRILTQEELKEIEVNNLCSALAACHGKIFGQQGAADLIGLPPTTLKSKLIKYKINPKSYAI